MAEDEEPLAERVVTLETTVAELGDRLDTATNRDIPLLKGTVQAVVDAEIDDIGELPDAGRSFHREVATQAERLDAVEEQLAALGDIGAAKTTKEEKLSAIVTYRTNAAARRRRSWRQPQKSAVVSVCRDGTLTS